MNSIKIKSATTTLASLPAVLLLFALLLSSTKAFAVNADNNDTEAVTWYQIEVILFKNMQPFELDKEHVTIDIATTDQKFVLVKGEPMVSNQLQRLDNSQLKLTKSFNAMNRSKNYKVLEFAGWKQPLTTEQSNIPLLIAAGQQYGKHHELEGSLTFSKSRYLHLHANLYMADYTRGPNINMQSWLLEDDGIAPHLTQLHVPASTLNDTPDESEIVMLNYITQQPEEIDASEEALTDTNQSQPTNPKPITNYIANNVVHMDESRRMRSGEIHYLDHPKFGLLVTIEPTDPPFVYNAPN